LDTEVLDARGTGEADTLSDVADNASHLEASSESRGQLDGTEEYVDTHGEADLATDLSDAMRWEVHDAGLDGEDLPNTGEDAADTGPQLSNAPVVINELIVHPTSQEVMELYNRLSNPVAVQEWALEVTSDSLRLWKLPLEIIPANGRLLLTLANLTPMAGATTTLLPNAGAVVKLYDEDDNLVDQVGYGTRGGAPLPTYGASTARLQDGLDTDRDAWDFNLSAVPTPGNTNVVPSVSLSQDSMVVSEIRAAGSHGEAFVRFEVLTVPFLNLSGWFLVLSGQGATGRYTFSDDLEMPPGAWVFTESQFPPLSQLAATGVLYLYSSSGARRYQMGWSSLDMTGEMSLGYVPGSYGTPDCFDDSTCKLVSFTSDGGETMNGGESN
jgi:hypothetical protein